MAKVIFVEWATHGRDFEIDLPLIYFFEKILKWEVDYISIFNLPKILSSSPDIIIMSNTGGAFVNSEISLLAKSSNIPLFSHVSEGLFRESNIKDMVYGWNETKLNEIHTTYWSYKSYSLAVKYFPEIQEKAYVSGSLSHDKYKIFRKKQGINLDGYNKVISYMSFDFHNLLKSREQFELRLGKKIVSLQIKHIKIINDILSNIVQKYNDILFLFKPHPGDGNKIPMELAGLNEYKNVKFLYNESTVDIINISDIVLNFQSSTNLEAWLLNKPSITIFEDKEFFDIYGVTKGSLNVFTFNELDKIIDEFYTYGRIKAFEKKKNIREKLIKDFIGFSDGLNHVRFASFLRPYIEDIEKGKIKKGKWNISIKNRLKGYIKHIVYSLSKGKYNVPYIKKWASVYDRFDDKEINKQKKLRYDDFDKFYKKNRKEIDNIYMNYSLNWKKELDLE